MAKDVAVILAAAGKSSRFGDSQSKKVFALLHGRAVWLHSADVFWITRGLDRSWW